MAIFSLHHAPIGKRTQKAPHTAAAHVGYISRRQAMSRYESARLAGSPRADAALLRQAEDQDRANARVADKVRLALPRELDPEQRAALVRGYAEEITQGRAPWLAAFHDQGKDAHNPHCHLLIRDRDPATGRRVIGMSEAGSTDRLRTLWEGHANKALVRAGSAERIDRRTLKAQGIDREPTIHEGPRAQQMARRGAQPRSRAINARNRPRSRTRERLVDYPRIDGGRSRPAYNAKLRGAEAPAELWATLDADAANREFAERKWQAAAGGPESSVDPIVAGERHIGQNPPDRLGAGAPVFLAPPIPRGQTRFVLGPTSLEPAANRIGERGDERTKANRKEVDNAVRNSVSLGHHDQSMEPETYKYKANMMSDEEVRNSRNRNSFLDAQHQADQSKSMFDGLMRRSYLNPDAAGARMDAYRAKHGNEALFGALEGNSRKTAFGRRPGSILSGDMFKPGAADKRQDSQIARQSLPEAARNHFRDQDRLKAAREAYTPLGMSSPPQAAPAAEPSRGPEHSRPPAPAPAAQQAPASPEPSREHQRPAQSPPSSPQQAPARQAEQPAPAPTIADSARDQRKADLMKGMAQRQARERELDKERGR